MQDLSQDATEPTPQLWGKANRSLEYQESKVRLQKKCSDPFFSCFSPFFAQVIVV